MARKIEVEIVGDASSYIKALGSAQKKTTSSAKQLMGKAALGGIAAGVTAIGVAAKIGWDEYNEGVKVAAQTNAVLKSTGNAANVTAKHVEDLGGALMLKSTMDDEAIKSGENLLLTFTNIRNEVGKGNDIFDQATRTMVDMSTALGQDASSSAIQLGKALNDPIKGITALQRVGVSFDQQTKDRITLLVEQGETLQAQKIILGELNTEFGGSAAAAAKTFGGQLTVLHNRLNNLLGDLVGKAIPYLQRFVVWVGPRAHEALVRAKEAVADARIAWARFGEVLARHQPTIERVRSAIVLLSKVIVPLIKWNILLYSTIFRVWMKILDVILTVTDKLIAAFRRIAGPAHAAFAAVAAAVRIAISPILTMINAVKTLISWINAIPDVIPGRSSNAGVPTGRPEHRAMGGPVSRLRPYLVGERGPELFVPRSSGRVVANGAGGGSVNVIVLGGDREAIDYLRRLDIRQSRRSGRGLL